MSLFSGGLGGYGHYTKAKQRKNHAEWERQVRYRGGYIYFVAIDQPQFKSTRFERVVFTIGEPTRYCTGKAAPSTGALFWAMVGQWLEGTEGGPEFFHHLEALFK